MNAYEIVRRASVSNPLLMPIPQSVMNDKIRNYVPTEKAMFYTFADGEKEYMILGGIAEDDLRP